ncbi:MAG TPA: FAD-dependent oxidoreductase [Aggregatilineales bacterium]|nr:FAD-dependent oxidoreductase [Aggregatilineales bacterium]
MSIKNAMSRRSFLKTAGMAGAAAAGSGLLSGVPGLASKVLLAQDVTYAREADVVVIGSGTGQLAAIRAAANGMSAIVLEKAQTGGGTTGISGGGIWIPNNYRMAEFGIPDSREEALEYLSRATFDQGDPELMEAYVDNCNPTVEFLRSIGIEWQIMPQFQDYYPEFPGGKPEGRSMSPISTIEGARGGGALARMLQQAGEQVGVEYVFSTAAKRLIVDEAGRVVGVSAETEGQEFNVRALRGVVVATGGFDHNETMVKNYLRGPLYYPSAVRGCTGDGQLMGMALGANLRNMNEMWGWPVYLNEEAGFGTPALATELGKPGAIVVNRAGKRFFNEAGAYDPATRAFYTYNNGTHEYENIPAYAIFDAGHRSRYTMAYNPPAGEVPSWVKRADTLEELAALLEIDAAELAATVERFNEYAAQGQDPDFKRGVSAFDQLTGGDRSRTDIANPCLAPLTEGPYYAMTIYPGSLGTCGGLQINTRAQVVNVWGEVIPGLYAVGNASGSVMGAGYPGGGATVGAGFTFGVLAADDMASNA